MIDVSVIMAVFNPDFELLKKSIDSLKNQGGVTFELILVDDGNELVVKEKIKKLIKCSGLRNVTILSNVRNEGLASSLNKAIRVSKGAYLARLDADDICLKGRLAEQCEFLKGNPCIGVLGGAALTNTGKLKRMPKFHKQICDHMFFDSPFIHPTVMLRRSLAYEFYNEAYSKAQDYELWWRLRLKGKRFHNFQKPLIIYNVRKGGNSSYTQKLNSARIRVRMIRRLLSSSGTNEKIKDALIVNALYPFRKLSIKNALLLILFFKKNKSLNLGLLLKILRRLLKGMFAR